MRKVKFILFAFAVSALLWAVNHTSDSAPTPYAGVARNHTRAVIFTDTVKIATAMPAVKPTE